jgi:hypothetical protein
MNIQKRAVEEKALHYFIAVVNFSALCLIEHNIMKTWSRAIAP